MEVVERRQAHGACLGELASENLGRREVHGSHSIRAIDT